MVEWWLVLHAALTWWMVGVIWLVQVVHYPLFDHVDAARFVSFEAAHRRGLGWVVGPVMVGELATAVAWVLLAPSGVAWAGLAMVVALWGWTFGVSVPCHRRLERGYDAAAHRRLVRTNWVRTGLWSARGVLVAWVLAAA